MELDELVTAWQANDAKIQQAVKLNASTLDRILSQKLKSALKSLLWQRIIELGFHAVALIFLLLFLIINRNQLPYALSAIALLAFYGYLFVNCLEQIRIILRLDSNKNVLSMQSSLMKIQTHLL